MAPYLAANEDLVLAGEVSKEAIDFLTKKIQKIETFIENKYHWVAITVIYVDWTIVIL